MTGDHLNWDYLSPLKQLSLTAIKPLLIWKQNWHRHAQLMKPLVVKILARIIIIKSKSTYQRKVEKWLTTRSSHSRNNCFLQHPLAGNETVHNLLVHLARTPELRMGVTTIMSTIHWAVVVGGRANVQAKFNEVDGANHLVVTTGAPVGVISNRFAPSE
jgi:hypothetical protein